MKKGKLQQAFDPDIMISSDDIERNGLKWCTVDEIRETLVDREPLIVNTSLRSQEGSHWIVLYPVDSEILIIDPLGARNDRLNEKVMKKQLKDYDIEFYDGKFQDPKTSLCGWFAIAVSKEIEGSDTIDEASEKTFELFGRTADDSDARKLIERFGVKQ